MRVLSQSIDWSEKYSVGHWIRWKAIASLYELSFEASHCPIKRSIWFGSEGRFKILPRYFPNNEFCICSDGNTPWQGITRLDIDMDKRCIAQWAVQSPSTTLLDLYHTQQAFPSQPNSLQWRTHKGCIYLNAIVGDCLVWRYVWKQTSRSQLNFWYCLYQFGISLFHEYSIVCFQENFRYSFTICCPLIPFFFEFLWGPLLDNEKRKDYAGDFISITLFAKLGSTTLPFCVVKFSPFVASLRAVCL